MMCTGMRAPPLVPSRLYKLKRCTGALLNDLSVFSPVFLILKLIMTSLLVWLPPDLLSDDACLPMFVVFSVIDLNQDSVHRPCRLLVADLCLFLTQILPKSRCFLAQLLLDLAYESTLLPTELGVSMVYHQLQPSVNAPWPFHYPCRPCLKF